MSARSGVPVTSGVKHSHSPRGIGHRGIRRGEIGYLQQRCAAMTGYPIEALATDTSFMGLGLDSLVAMTLSNHLRRDYAVSIPVTQILLSTSLEALAREVQAARERVITRATSKPKML